MRCTDDGVVKGCIPFELALFNLQSLHESRGFPSIFSEGRISENHLFDKCVNEGDVFFCCRQAGETSQERSESLEREVSSWNDQRGNEPEAFDIFCKAFMLERRQSTTVSRIISEFRGCPTKIQENDKESLGAGNTC